MGISSSLIIGMIAGFLVVVSVLFFDKVKIDDPVGATSVHLVCGIFGTLALGLFPQDQFTPNTTGRRFVFRRGRRPSRMKQLVGVVGVGAFVFVLSLIFWKIIAATVGIRVPAEEEIEGLDIGEHGNVAYPDFVTVTARGAAIVDAAGRTVQGPAGSMHSC